MQDTMCFQSNAKQKEPCWKLSKLLDLKLYYRAVLAKKERGPEKSRRVDQRNRMGIYERTQTARITYWTEVIKKKYTLEINHIQQIVLSKLDIPLQKSNVRSTPFPLIKNKFKFNKKTSRFKT